MELKHHFVSLMVYLVMLGAAMCASNPSRAADVTEYRVEISDLDNTKTKEEFTCYDTKMFCRAMLPIKISGGYRSLDVTVFFEPGNAYFSFSINGRFLSIGAQNFFLMSIGQYGTQESKISLRASLPDTKTPDMPPPATPPVLRYSRDILVNLKISIHYIRTYSHDTPANSP
jgi:hypothetical protein